MFDRQPNLWIAYGLGVLSFALAACLIPVSLDWDTSFYMAVARNIVEGRGPVVDAVFTTALELPMPAPANVYWMPLPSRVLLPLSALFGEMGGRMTNVLIAGWLGPLSLLIARQEKVSSRMQWAVLLFSIFPFLCWTFCAQTDAYALTGVLGAIAIWSARSKRVMVTCLSLIGLSLTRSDGWMVAPFVAILFPHYWQRGLCLLAGVASTAAWSKWVNMSFPNAWTLKKMALQAGDYASIWDGHVSALSYSERFVALFDLRLIEAIATKGGLFLEVGLLVSVFVLKRSNAKWLLSLLLLHHIAATLLAPAVALHGTLSRTAFAWYLPFVVSSVHGWAYLIHTLDIKRGHPPARTWLLLIVAFSSMTLAMGMKHRAKAFQKSECDFAKEIRDPNAVVLSSAPLELLACQRKGVIMTARMSKKEIIELMERYGVTYAIARPGKNDKEWLSARRFQKDFPGWEPLNEALFTLPSKNDSTRK